MKKKGNILIIDDNEAMLVSLRMLLKNVFEDVQTSTNPNAIPTLMRRKRPEVVLLDMNFGRGINNGNEGLFWLKEIKHTEPDVAVVLFTAYAYIDLAVRGIKEGASDFIVKPFENEVLIEKLRALLPSAGRLSHADNDAQPLLPPVTISATSSIRFRCRGGYLWQPPSSPSSLPSSPSSVAH